MFYHKKIINKIQGLQKSKYKETSGGNEFHRIVMFKSSCCAIFQRGMSSAGMYSMAGLEMQPQKKNNLFILNEGAFRELL